MVIATDQKLELALPPKARPPDQQACRWYLEPAGAGKARVSKSSTSLTSQMLGGNFNIFKPETLYYENKYNHTRECTTYTLVYRILVPSSYSVWITA